jgi:hypothetical protein
VQQNQAIGLINGILTTPRPGGFAGIQNGPYGAGAGQTVPAGTQPNATFSTGFGSTPGSPIGTPIGSSGNTIGGGIAGVASNADADSIMVYDDHTNYSQWEFVFDPTKWHAPPNPNQGTIGTSAAQLGSSPNNLGSSSPSGASPGSSFGVGGGTFSAGVGVQSSTGAPGQMSGGQTGGGQMGGGQMGGGQMGTTGMPGTGSSAFGGGGLPDIRPGRR